MSEKPISQTIDHIRIRPYKRDDGVLDGFEIYFSVKYPDGRRPHPVRKKSPKSTVPQTLAWAKELRANYYKAGRPLGRVAQKAAKITAKKPLSIPTLASFVPRWIEGHVVAEKLKQSTRDAYEWAIEKYLLYLFGKTPLDQIGTEAFSRLKAKLATKENGEDRSARQRNQIVSLLYQILEKAKEWEILTTLPTRPKRIKEPKKEVVIYSQDEFERLVVGAQKVGWQAHLVVLLGGDAGLRAGEIQGLRWSDIDLKAGVFVVRQQVQVKGRVDTPKSGASRSLDMTPRLREALEKYQHLMGNLVLARTHERKVKRHNLQLWLASSEKRAKLIGDPKSLHKLRHTFASRLLAAGATIKELQVLLGHASLQTTLMYLHLLPSEGRRAIALLGGEKVERTR